MFGIDINKLNAFKQGQLITGKGTGTSDDIKMSAPKGSYILPADTTAHLGLNGIHDYIRGLQPQEHIPRTENININVSNGEYILPPHAVKQIGTDTLDDIRQATHNFRDKNSDMNFADGGQVGGIKRKHTNKDNSPLKRHFYDGGGAGATLTEDERKRREAELRQQNAWTGTDTAKAAALGTAAAGYGAGKALSPALENAFGQTAGQIAKEGIGNAWGAMKNMVGKFEAPTIKGAFSPTGMMKGNLAMSGVQGAFTGYDTPTEQYRDRFGLQTKDPSLAGDLAVRALGVASDVGNAATFGLLGKTFQDKEMAKWNPANPVPATPTPANNAPTTTTPTNKPTSWADDPEIKKLFPATGTPSDVNLQDMTGTRKAIAAAPTATTAPTQPSASDIARQNYQQIATQSQELLKNAGNIQQPNAPSRGYDDRVARENLLQQLSTVQPGARGITAAQMRGQQELAQGDDRLRQDVYNQQMQMSQAQMREQGETARQTFAQNMAMGKALLDDAGTNARYNAGLGLDMAKFNQQSAMEQAKLGLEKDKLGFEKDKNNTANYANNRMIGLQQQYDNATTDAERQAIIAKSQSSRALSGTAAVTGKDRYMAVQGGQEIDPVTQAPITRPSGVFDTQTGQMVNVGGGQNGKLPINQNPKAIAILQNTKLSQAQQQEELKKLGYAI